MNEEELIERYFDAFNRHDLDAVMKCFDERAVIVGSDGSRYEGVEAVREMYAAQFAVMPDSRCDLQSLLGGGGRGVAESSFHGTRRKDGLAINAVGVEMFEFRDGRIAEIRDYHRLLR